MAEPRHDARAVDLGRLELRAVDGLQSGEQKEHEERNALPDVYRDDRRHREMRIGEPAERPVDDPQPDQDRIEAAEERVEDALPRQRRDDLRHDPRQKDDARQHVAVGQPAVEHQRDGQPGDELQQQRPEREVERVGDRLVIVGVGPELGVIAKADPVGLAGQEVQRGPAQPDRLDERPGDQPDHQHDHRQHEGKRDLPVPPEDRLQPPVLRSDAPAGRSLRHRLISHPRDVP